MVYILHDANCLAYENKVLIFLLIFLLFLAGFWSRSPTTRSLTKRPISAPSRSYAWR